MSGRKVAGAIRFLVNARGLQLDCERMLHKALLVLVLLHISETMIWGERERSRIRVLQMDNLRGTKGIIRMDRVPNAQIRELCRVAKGVGEGIDKSALRWFGDI